MTLEEYVLAQLQKGRVLERHAHMRNVYSFPVLEYSRLIHVSVLEAMARRGLLVQQGDTYVLV